MLIIFQPDHTGRQRHNVVAKYTFMCNSYFSVSEYHVHDVTFVANRRCLQLSTYRRVCISTNFRLTADGCVIHARSVKLP